MVELLIFIALGVLILILFEGRERYRAKHPEKFPETKAANTAATGCVDSGLTPDACASCAIAEVCTKPEKKGESSESDKSVPLQAQD